MHRWPLVLLLITSGCGLFGPTEEVGFREYPLRDTPYDEGGAVVYDATTELFREIFGGGFTVEWDPVLGNLEVSPIYDANRRMTLYVKVSARGDDTIVEMLALVESLSSSMSGAPDWGVPQQDVPLEEKLYRAILLELVERRAAGGS